MLLDKYRRLKWALGLIMSILRIHPNCDRVSTCMLLWPTNAGLFKLFPFSYLSLSPIPQDLYVSLFVFVCVCAPAALGRMLYCQSLIICSRFVSGRKHWDPEIRTGSRTTLSWYLLGLTLKHSLDTIQTIQYFVSTLTYCSLFNHF